MTGVHIVCPAKRFHQLSSPDPPRRGRCLHRGPIWAQGRPRPPRAGVGVSERKPGHRGRSRARQSQRRAGGQVGSRPLTQRRARSVLHTVGNGGPAAAGRPAEAQARAAASARRRSGPPGAAHPPLSRPLPHAPEPPAGPATHGRASGWRAGPPRSTLPTASPPTRRQHLSSDAWGQDPQRHRPRHHTGRGEGAAACPPAGGEAASPPPSRRRPWGTRTL